MGIAAPPTQPLSAYLSLPKTPPRPPAVRPKSPPGSMSQGFHHRGIFSFSDGGFDRPGSQEQQRQQHVAQQSRRDKLRVQGYDPGGHPLVPMDEEAEDPTIYGSTAAAATNNMLSEMFNFPAMPAAAAAAGLSATELLASQMSANYSLGLRPAPVPMTGVSDDWYGASRQGMMMNNTNSNPMGEPSSSSSKHPHAMSALGTDSAAAMHLFLMNPQQHHARSPSPQPPDPQALHQHQAFQAFGGTDSFGGGGGGVVEGQGLSLSLSSSLQQADELRVRDGVLFFNSQQQAAAQLPPSMQMPPGAGHQLGQGQAQQQLHIGYGPAGVVNVLRNSRYARAAQELLEEFCSVGRGQLKAGRAAGHPRTGSSTSNPNPKPATGALTSAAAAASSSTSSKDNVPQLSPADRFEHQRKKAKLISMLDEVDRRYNHYCDQMQMVVNFFDSVMGFGAATPYTVLAQKAMSRHFRCLKEAVAAQLRQTCELLGEKDAGAASGLTKGETPRLRMLDQGLRQQRAFHHMGMMEQEAWRPQRGLPERSVNILRAWLFEHFLHPYPSDADKHLLARQTGLSRNQVSNWFINARVRLWKPMIEEMYQQEGKDAEGTDGATDSSDANLPRSPTPSGGPHKPDPSLMAPPSSSHHGPAADDTVLLGIDPVELLGGDAHVGPTAADMYGQYRAAAAAAAAMRYGAAAGDVSLTLGLRHAGGNAGDGTGRFSVRDFGGC